MKSITLETPQFIKLAQLVDDRITHFPIHLGMHCWQRALLAIAALQIKLPAKAFATSVVTPWNQQTLRSILDSQLAPQTSARILALVQTCGYDAWSAYDPVALSTQLGGALRRPPAERTEQNKAKAFSYGAYRALLDFFPKPDQQTSSRSFMRSLGFDPDDDSTDTTTPAGIGNVAAAAILASPVRTAPVNWQI